MKSTLFLETEKLLVAVTVTGPVISFAVNAKDLTMLPGVATNPKRISVALKVRLAGGGVAELVTKMSSSVHLAPSSSDEL